MTHEALTRDARRRPEPGEFAPRLSPAGVRYERWRLAADMLSLMQKDTPEHTATAVHLSVVRAALDELATTMEHEQLIPQRVHP